MEKLEVPIKRMSFEIFGIGHTLNNTLTLYFAVPKDENLVIFDSLGALGGEDLCWGDFALMCLQLAQIGKQACCSHPQGLHQALTDGDLEDVLAEQNVFKQFWKFCDCFWFQFTTELALGPIICSRFTLKTVIFWEIPGLNAATDKVNLSLEV